MGDNTPPAFIAALSVAPNLMTTRERLTELARRWRVDVGEFLETESSLIGYGRGSSHQVVIKVVKKPGDEWSSGEVLRAFEGRGVVRVVEYVDGAMLLERLVPGESLASMSLDDRDDQATEILAALIASMSPTNPPQAAPIVEDWGKSFDRYSATGDQRIANDLLQHARTLYVDLCRTQKRRRLLHGDLHHHNTLFDETRGWLAIDPKGVVGEIEYEVGAAFRNPYERPELFTDPATIEARLNRFVRKLDVDGERTLRWIFAQAVLSAVWSIEDGFSVDQNTPTLRLAAAIRPMLPAAR